MITNIIVVQAETYYLNSVVKDLFGWKTCLKMLAVMRKQLAKASTSRRGWERNGDGVVQESAGKES